MQGVLFPVVALVKTAIHDRWQRASTGSAGLAGASMPFKEYHIDRA
jgi:hypothetical protein